MNSICRFCLKSTKEMQELTEESQIYKKILLCMNVQIKPLENPLPNKICKYCSEKVDDIYEFHERVTEADKLLMKYQHKGLQDINELFKVNNKFKVKDVERSIDNKENLDTDCVKTEIINTENGDTDDSNLDNVNFECDSTIEVKANIEIAANNKDNKPILLNITQFKCLTCFEMLESKNLLLNHYNTKHNKKQENGSMKENFTVSSVNGNIVFNCYLCNKQYNDKKSIVRHNLRVHVDDRPFICKLCSRTYKTASEIVRHSRAHNGTRLFCSKQCGYSTVYLGALKEHEKRHNRDELKYKCEKCGKGFQVKTWYEQHQNVHKGLKPYVCDICGVAFHMDRYLTSHRSSVHPQSSNLKRYVCVHCSHPCDSQNALTQHLKEHGINTSFLCDLCGRTLSNAKQLNFHKIMHLGKKPFTCSTCNKSFTKKFNLQLHERTHSGEKAHACLQCGKCYSQRSTLRRHNARNHSEQMKCQKCIKTFTNQNEYTAHKKLCI